MKISWESLSPNQLFTPGSFGFSVTTFQTKGNSHGVKGTGEKGETNQRVIPMLSHHLSQGSRRKRCRFHPWVGTIPWRRAWQPTPVFLPGASHGQRSLGATDSPQGCKEPDKTEQLKQEQSLLYRALERLSMQRLRARMSGMIPLAVCDPPECSPNAGTCPSPVEADESTWFYFITAWLFLTKKKTSTIPISS